MQSNLQNAILKETQHPSCTPHPSISDHASKSLHVAIIMDGNGRWGKKQGQDRLYGHKMGVKAVRRAVMASLDEKIGMLTLYGFSSDNMARPEAEVSHFFDLLRHYLAVEVPHFVKSDIRLVVIGRRDRMPKDLRVQIESAEKATSKGERLIVRIALDYSARQQILAAMHEMPLASPEALSKKLSGIDEEWPVDLLIRTSGEQRLSDFLLWESAYAELHFTPIFWPDFTKADLRSALDLFSKRHRRFGAVGPKSG